MDDQFLDKGRPKNPTEEFPEILQPVPIPLSADPAIAVLLAAINETNTFLLQQNQRIGPGRTTDRGLLPIEPDNETPLIYHHLGAAFHQERKSVMFLSSRNATAHLL